MVAMRWPFTQIPLWQLGLSWVLLILAAVGSILGAARIFRVGMLRFGQPISLPAAIRAIRSQNMGTQERENA
jgi:ABC-2 type transport system permease protein